jgi:hypothetical protein
MFRHTWFSLTLDFDFFKLGAKSSWKHRSSCNIDFGSDDILETMLKHVRSLNIHSIILCIGGLLMLTIDMHVFGRNAM